MNNIQDILLTVGSVVFAIALIPSILSPNKPALATSISTTVVLFVFAGVYVSLELWFASITTVVTGLLWLSLGVQKIQQNKKKANKK